MGHYGDPPRGSVAAKYEMILRDIALEFPEAYEDRPWGSRAFKARKKTFVFLHADPDGLHLSMKLPASKHEALLLPFTEPTHYGMGKHGWVTSHFAVDEIPPVPILTGWFEESYRAVCVKALVAQLDGANEANAGSRTRSPAPPAKAKKKKKKKKKKASRKKA